MQYSLRCLLSKEDEAVQQKVVIQPMTMMMMIQESEGEDKFHLGECDRIVFLMMIVRTI